MPFRGLSKFEGLCGSQPPNCYRVNSSNNLFERQAASVCTIQTLMRPHKAPITHFSCHLRERLYRQNIPQRFCVVHYLINFTPNSFSWGPFLTTPFGTKNAQHKNVKSVDTTVGKKLWAAADGEEENIFAE